MAGVGSGVREELFEEADFFPDYDETTAVAVGEGLEEDAVDYGEEGGGGSDAEGEGEDRGEGEAGGLAELAKTVTQVLQDGVHGLPRRFFLVCKDTRKAAICSEFVWVDVGGSYPELMTGSEVLAREAGRNKVVCAGLLRVKLAASPRLRFRLEVRLRALLVSICVLWSCSTLLAQTNSAVASPKDNCGR